MKKRMIAILMSLIIGTNLMGCNIRSEEKKIVLEENVGMTESNSNKNIENTEIETLNLSLKEDEYFMPMFYESDEIYGYISRLSSRVSIKPTDEEYPVYSGVKEYLYSLNKNNELEESNREVGTIYERNLGVSSIGRKYKNDGTEEGYIKINYNESNGPEELPGLKVAVQKIESEYKGWGEELWVMQINEDFVYLSIEYEDDKYHDLRKTYLYDINSDRLYECGETSNNNGSLTYVEGMDSIIFIDHSLNSYKVKFEEDKYYLDKYISLGEISDTESFFTVQNSENEMCIIKYKYVWDKEMNSKSMRKITSISMYDFSSNKLETLFEGKDDTNFTEVYVGNNIVILDEFYINENKSHFENRYVYKIIDGSMELVLIDNISREGLDEESITTAILSDGGKEIFIFTDRDARNYSDVSKSDELIYKRYKLE